MKSFGNAVRTAPRVRASLARSTRCWNASVAAAQRSGMRCASSSSSSASSSPKAEIQKTHLYDLHVARGGKMVPFADYSLPVQYTSASIADSHHFTRKHASLFDVSHMVQHIFQGPQAAAFLERLTPSDWKSQGLMQSKLTTLLWPESGGIVDDCVITRLGVDVFFAVTNGACFEKDCRYLDEQMRRYGTDVQWSRQERGAGLVALQGPRAAEILNEALAEDGGENRVNLDRLYFGSSAFARLRYSEGGKPRTTDPVLITRGGYTGEDGFEISFGAQTPVPGETTALVAESLLEMAGPERLQLAGLGARDSL
ncbi:hypothetical protein E4U42_001781, partial [Claviceps africana]